MGVRPNAMAPSSVPSREFSSFYNETLPVGWYGKYICTIRCEVCVSHKKGERKYVFGENLLESSKTREKK